MKRLPALLLPALMPVVLSALSVLYVLPVQAAEGTTSATGNLQRRVHLDRAPAEPASAASRSAATASAAPTPTSADGTSAERHVRPGSASVALGAGSGDGLTDRPLWLDSSRIAEFDTSGNAGEPTLVTATQGRYTLQSVAKSLGAGSVMTPATVADNRSPVFVDASGRARALPGGVIVTFAAAGDPAADSARLEAAGLQPLRRLNSRSWLVASDPGLAALTLAQQLQNDPRFARVQPNWWVTRQRK